MIANLHLHSVFSDGTQWPEEIAARAKRAGYQMVALTDHDTMQGTADFSRACAHHGIKGVPGVEIDCIASEFSFDKEMLGYFPKGKHIKTTEFTERLRVGRMRKINHYLERAREVVFKAHPRAPELTYAELVKFKLGFTSEQALQIPFSWNKSNFYSFLRSKSITGGPCGQKAEPGDDAYQSFKKKYFTTGLLDEPVHDDKPGLDEVVSIIVKDGGFPVLPHYGHLYNDDIDSIKKNEERLVMFLRHCQDIGVRGVEQYYYNNPSYGAINDYIVKLCKKLGLPFKFTFGSDCHGRGHDNCTLELFSGDFQGFA
nr:PHP domain-containing protein [Candidatus Sigynarchaeum springense]